MIIARLKQTHTINGKKESIEYNAYQTGANAYKIVETYPNGLKKHYEFSSFDSMNDTWNTIKRTVYALNTVEIGKIYRDVSVPSEPKFIVESIKDGVASGHYAGDMWAEIDHSRDARVRS